MNMNNETQEILDRIDKTLKLGKTEMFFNKSELDSSPAKKSIIDWLKKLKVIQGGLYSPGENNSGPGLIPYVPKKYYEDKKEWEEKRDKEFDEFLDKSEVQIYYIIDKDKFLKLHSTENNKDIEESSGSIVKFNGKTISYRNEIYRPDNPILCLVNYAWDKKYISGANIQKGLDLGQTVPRECGINDIERSIDSFNRIVRKKKIPLRLKMNNKKIYLEENQTDQNVIL